MKSKVCYSEILPELFKKLNLRMPKSTDEDFFGDLSGSDSFDGDSGDEN